MHSVRAVLNGTATPEQQRGAMRWIMSQACRRLDLPWLPGGADAARQSDMLVGRQFVGILIGNMTDEATLEKAKADDEARRKAAIVKATGLNPEEAGKLVEQVRARVTRAPHSPRRPRGKP